jgi:V/A-type H+-transporting ATPase subunit E
MGLEPTIQTILDEGKAEATKIVETGRAERERMLREARERGEALRSEREAAAKRVGERMRVQDLARAELEAKKALLQAQKEVLDEVKRGALQALGNFKDNDKVLRALVERHGGEVKEGKVYCNAKDGPLVKQLVPKGFGGIIDCVGGVVIESEDGARRLDLRYETLLDESWEVWVKGVADLLWREG